MQSTMMRLLKKKKKKKKKKKPWKTLHKNMVWLSKKVIRRSKRDMFLSEREWRAKIQKSIKEGDEDGTAQ